MTRFKFKDIISLITLFIIGYVFLFLVGGTVLSLLGLKYNNIFSLAKFIAFYYIMSLPVESLVFPFFKIMREVKNLSHIQYYTLFFFVDISFSMFLMGISEYIMKDVSCSMMTAFLFTVICFLVNMFFDLKNNFNKDKEVA